LECQSCHERERDFCIENNAQKVPGYTVFGRNDAAEGFKLFVSFPLEARASQHDRGRA
jgi:hypothetical protein